MASMVLPASGGNDKVPASRSSHAAVFLPGVTTPCPRSMLFD